MWITKKEFNALRRRVEALEQAGEVEDGSCPKCGADLVEVSAFGGNLSTTHYCKSCGYGHGPQRIERR